VDKNAQILKDCLVHEANAPNSFSKIQCGTSSRQLWLTRLINPLVPEIQKFWICRFSRDMLFEMLSWNWYESVFRELHFLKSFFWPYDISCTGILRMCQELMWPICWIIISMISTGATSSFYTFYWEMKNLACKDRKATALALTLSSHNLPTDGASELLKL